MDGMYVIEDGITWVLRTFLFEGILRGWEDGGGGVDGVYGGGCVWVYARVFIVSACFQYVVYVFMYIWRV